MAINAGSAEIIITADAKGLLPAIKAATAAASKIAAKEGNKLGKSLETNIGKSLSNLGTSLVSGGLLPALGKIGAAFTALNPQAVIGMGAAVVALTAAIGQGLIGAATVASGAMAALGLAAITAKLGFSGFGEAVSKGGDSLAKLAPNARAAAVAVRGLKSPFNDLKKSISEKIFAGTSSQISKLSGTITKGLKPGMTSIAGTINKLVTGFLAWATSARGIRQINTLTTGLARVFKNLAPAIGSIGKALLTIFTAALPSTNKFAKGVSGMAARFNSFIQSANKSGKLQAFFTNAGNAAKNLFGIFGHLGQAIGIVFSAGAGSGRGILATLNGMTKSLVQVTQSAKDSGALAGFFSSIGNTASTFKSIMKTVGPIVSGVFQAIQTAMGPALAGVRAGLTALAPHLTKLMAALQPLMPVFKLVGTVVGEIARQMLSFLGTALGVVTPLIGFLAKALGGLAKFLQPFASIIATVIFAFTGFGPAIGGIIPVIGKFIRPLLEVSQFFSNVFVGALNIGAKVLMRVFGAALKAVGPTISFVGGLIGKVFGGIKTVIVGALNVVRAIFNAVFPNLASGTKTYFTIIKTVITTVFTVIKATIRTAFAIIRGIFSSVLGAIRGIVVGAFNFIRSVIMTYVNIWRAIISKGFSVIRGVFTSVLGFVRGLVGRVFGGIAGTIGGVMGRIRGIISGAWNFVKSNTTAAFNNIRNVVGNIIGGIKTKITSGFSDIVSKVRAAPGKILSLASGFLSAGTDLGKKVITGLGRGLAGLVGNIGDFGAMVKGKINAALHLPKTIHGPGPIPDFTIPGFARGTNFAPGGVALVGEKGPELVNLPRGSQVKTANETSRIAREVKGSSGTPDVKITQIFNGPTTSGGRLRELDWTVRYATKARGETISGVAS